MLGEETEARLRRRRCVVAAPASFSCVGRPQHGGACLRRVCVRQDQGFCGKRAQALLVDSVGASSQREAELVLKFPALPLDGGASPWWPCWLL